MTRDRLIAFMPEMDWDAVLRTNLKGAFNCSTQALSVMIPKKHGRIINITSIAGIIGNKGQTNYAASKAGLIDFTKALAAEAGRHSITVNAVAAGYIPTALTEELLDSIKQNMVASIPLRRSGSPEDVAQAVAFLASAEANYITGQTLNVDGGMVMD